MLPNSVDNQTQPRNYTFRHTLCIFFFCSLYCLSGAGCGAVYAPPARVHQSGAPAKFKARQMEVEAAGTITSESGSLHGGLDYAPTDWVQLEAGANGTFGSFGEKFALGYLGARFAPYSIEKQTTKVKLLLDIETGAALGSGGNCDPWGPDRTGRVLACETDELRWHERIAGGGYAGFGIGMNIKWFDLYARNRFQITTAKKIPTTIWYSAMGGTQFTIANTVKLYAGFGVGLYHNEVDDFHDFIGEAGLSVYFDTAPRSKDATDTEPTSEQE